MHVLIVLTQKTPPRQGARLNKPRIHDALMDKLTSEEDKDIGRLLATLINRHENFSLMSGRTPGRI